MGIAGVNLLDWCREDPLAAATELARLKRELADAKAADETEELQGGNEWLMEKAQKYEKARAELVVAYKDKYLPIDCPTCVGSRLCYDPVVNHVRCGKCGMEWWDEEVALSGEEATDETVPDLLAALRLILDECRIVNRGTPEMEKIERIALSAIRKFVEK